MRIIISIVAMFCYVALSGLTLTVCLDGSGQFTSIQSAVEAASNGDIVLVHPGRYFENVDFLNKSIAINSLEATTGDNTYISSTIIDGSRQAPCVSFKNGLHNASLRGFTLTNGQGEIHFTQQISVGGGVQIYSNCNVTITNCDIWNNYARMGAGLFLYKSSAVFQGLRIHNNYATSFCGGMFIWGFQTHYPNIVFDPNNLCSIYENYGVNPTDIEVTDIHQNLQINLDLVSVANPSEFYIHRTSNFTVTSNYHDTINYQRTYRSEINHDLYVSPDGNDENSGLDPSQALRSITLAIHRIKADSLNVHTVHLLPGVFSIDDQIFPIPLKSYVNLIGAGSGQSTILYDEHNALHGANVVGSFEVTKAKLSGFKIQSGLNPDLITVTPLFILGYIVDSEVSDVVIEGFHFYKHGIILKPVRTTYSKLIIRNCTAAEVAVTTISDWVSGTLKDCVFENIESLNDDEDQEDLRTVIDFWIEERINIENCVFRNIRVRDQQLVFHVSNCRQDNQPVEIVVNNTVFDNLRHNGYAPIIFVNRNVNSYTVSNCTLVNNYGTDATIGTGGKVKYRNNIMYNPDSPKEMYIALSIPYGFYSYIYLDYNIVHGGLSGISNPWNGNILVYGQNNIDADPIFASTNINDPMYLRLSASSPCVNAGTPDTLGLFLPPYDLTGNWRIWDGRIDMGCYEYGSEPYVGVDDPVVPELPAFSICNYPNPFTGFTNIKVILPSNQGNDKARVTNASIDIYNIKGQRVKSIPLDPGKAGEQFSYWDGRDEAGRQCSSGIYLLNLKVNGIRELSKKVTLIR